MPTSSQRALCVKERRQVHTSRRRPEHPMGKEVVLDLRQLSVFIYHTAKVSRGQLWTLAAPHTSEKQVWAGEEREGPYNAVFTNMKLGRKLCCTLVPNKILDKIWVSRWLAVPRSKVMAWQMDNHSLKGLNEVGQRVRPPLICKVSVQNPFQCSWL